MTAPLPPHPADSPPAGPCLDANDVAALCGTSLAPDEREALVTHLLGCGACRGWVGAAGAVLQTDGSSGDSDPLGGHGQGALLPLRGRARWLPFSIAAAALLAIGVGILRSPRLETATTAQAEAARIGSTYLTWLDVEALRRPLGPERGGVVILAPIGTVATARPEVAWTDLPGATSAHVTIRDAEGALRLDATARTSRLPWPADLAPLAPGARYVARVVVSTPTGDASGSVAFRVPSAAEDEFYALLLARIRSRARPAWQALLCAHEAAVERRWAEADAFLTQAVVDGAPAAEVAALRTLVDPQLGRAGP